MHLKWGTVGEGKKGMGRRRGGGGQYTANLGSEWTGIRATTKEGFQVSKRRAQGIRVGISEQRGITKRIGACTSVYCVNRVYIMLIKDCV
jgi:hypothetical protein